MRSFKVTYMDYNEQIFSAENIVSVMNYVIYKLGRSALEIIKIEEVM